jgi:hypothetical protein
MFDQITAGLIGLLLGAAPSLVYFAMKFFKAKRSKIKSALKSSDPAENLLRILKESAKEVKGSFKKKEIKNIINGTTKVYKKLRDSKIPFKVVNMAVGFCEMSSGQSYAYEVKRYDYDYFMRKAKRWNKPAQQILVYKSNLEDDYVMAAFIEG